MKELRDLLPLSVTQYDPIEVQLSYPPIRGYGCFSPIHKPTPLASFKIPVNSYLKVSDWIPSNRPVKGDVWYGVERFIDPGRLAGLVYEGHNGYTLEEMVMNGSAYANREGANISHVFCPIDLYDQVVKFRSAYGKPKVIASNEIDSEIIMLQLDTWKKYANTLTCSAPLFNMRILLDEEQSK